MAQEDNSVSYLSALKRASQGTAAAPALEAGADKTPAEAATSARADKRRSPRYKCEGSAEIRQEGIDQRTWATFADLSLHGCYVEATSTYPVGTHLHLKLEANTFRIAAEGTVRVTYPYLGMGIAFTALSEENRTRLRELLRSVSRPSVILGSGLSSVPSVPQQPESMPAVTNTAAAVKAMIQFFDERQLLSREEFLRILRKSQGM